MQKDIQYITIIPARACDSLLDAGIREQETFYLAWDQQAHCLFVVQWERVRWGCSCGKAGCLHQRATNTYVFEQSQKNKSEVSSEIQPYSS